MDTLQNYYQILHVLPDAPSPVIKASFRAMMQKMRNHPDLGGDPSRAQLLNEAVKILCDPARRAVYDRQLQASQSRPEKETPTQTTHREKASPTAQQPGHEPEDEVDMPGGRPNNYGRHEEGQDRSEAPETDQRSARKTPFRVPRTLLPTRPHCLFCKASFATVSRSHQYYLSNPQCHQCGAPSAPLEQLNTSTTEELRRIYRHDHHAVVRLWTHWPPDIQVEARLQDFSLAGCAIESVTWLDGDAIVLLDTKALKAICQVRYCKPLTSGAMYSIGLAFKTLETKARPGTMFSAIA